jgi:hypothetical protein
VLRGAACRPTADAVHTNGSADEERHQCDRTASSDSGIAPVKGVTGGRRSCRADMVCADRGRQSCRSAVDCSAPRRDDCRGEGACSGRPSGCGHGDRGASVPVSTTSESHCSRPRVVGQGRARLVTHVAAGGADLGAEVCARGRALLGGTCRWVQLEPGGGRAAEASASVSAMADATP